MLVGAFHFPTDYGIEIGELARALEARGLESLFVCDHTHIPVSRRSPYPGGGELPTRYSHTHDPFVALSFAAAATRTLKLGTGIALIRRRGCAKPPSRPDAIPRRSRSRCSTRRPIRRRSHPIARRGSRACCSKCPM